MTTFLTLQNEVQYHIRQRGDLLTFVKDKLNSALLDVMLLVKPPEFQSTFAVTTTAGTSAYALGQASPDDVLAVTGVSIDVASVSTANRRLIRGTYEEFDEMDTTDTGQPRKWFRYANDLILYNRVPDNNGGSDYSVTVRILERPTTLSADSDVFPLAPEWEEPVVLRAVAKMFTLLGNQERKALTDTLFQESVGFVVDRIQSIENSNDGDAGMRQATHRVRPASGRSRR
jgi:hypothetical protein